MLERRFGLDGMWGVLRILSHRKNVVQYSQSNFWLDIFAFRKSQVAIRCWKTRWNERWPTPKLAARVHWVLRLRGSPISAWKQDQFRMTDFLFCAKISTVETNVVLDSEYSDWLDSARKLITTGSRPYTDATQSMSISLSVLRIRLIWVCHWSRQKLV